ncbi:MAG: T9SS type A sorting domain-containing protein, partial [Bacteroidota bacterium]|nr:T9SS type A sorting domain-containing protein [Bacteroidota bacterium]
IYPAYNGINTQFNGNIAVNSTAGGGVHFGQGMGISTLATDKIISAGIAGFSAGNLSLRNFTQTGATAQSITLTGWATLYYQAGTTFNGNLNSVSPGLRLDGSTFNGVSNFTKTGSTNDAGEGGNAFNEETIITNSGSALLSLGFINPDIFAKDLTVNNTGSNNISIVSSSAGNVFNGNVILNASGSGATNIIEVASGADATAIFNGTVTANNNGTATNNQVRFNLNGFCTFNNNIIVNSTAGPIFGIYFGQPGSTGTASLADSKTISVGAMGFSAGDLRFYNFNQIGGTTQSLTLTGTAALYMGAGTTFNGNLTAISPQVYLNGATFNGVTSIEKSGAVNNISMGGNTFSTTTVIKNSGSGIMYLANTFVDDFDGDVTFIRTGSGTLNPAYNTNCTFAESISTAGSTGIVTFAAAAGGRITINGNGSANFNGDAAFPPNLSRLTMATSGGGTLNLNVNITVSTDLAFTSGIINATTVSSTATGLLILNNGITMSDGADNGSYVNGYVRKIGNTSFTFPVGAVGVYAPVSISSPALASDHFTARYIKATPNTSYSRNQKETIIDHISNCEYWMLDRTGGTSYAYVTLSWDTRSCGVDMLSDLSVARWNGTQWWWEGNGGTTGNTTTGTIITSGEVISFGPFTLASVAYQNPLPVKVLSYTGICNNGITVLKWNTATETNNASFAIERSSDDINWQLIGTLNGAGNSSAVRSYSFSDKEPYKKASYYRLKQTDYDGRFAYSKTIAVKNCREDLIELNIFPNPSNGKFNMFFKGDEKQIRSVEIYDALGKKVYRSINYQPAIDLSGMQNGIYFLHLYMTSKNIIKKIVIER